MVYPFWKSLENLGLCPGCGFLKIEYLGPPSLFQLLSSVATHGMAWHRALRVRSGPDGTAVGRDTHAGTHCSGGRDTHAEGGPGAAYRTPGYLEVG